jgi:hypothetical protein
LTGMTFMNRSGVHGVLFRERVVRVGGGGRRGGRGGKGFVGKGFTVMNNAIQNGSVKVARFSNVKAGFKGFLYFLDVSITGGLI